MSEVVNKVVPIEAIKPHPENYNTHPDEQIQQLGMSYSELGQFRSIVLWDQGNGTYIQLAGHGVIEAMKRNGAKEARADVLSTSLDPLVAKRIMLADNLHAQNSSPDDELLAHLLQEQQDAGFDLVSLGTDDEALRQMLEALGDEFVGGESERDETEDELPEEVEPRAKVGDIWQLGRHKVICGDSSDPETLKSLIGNEQVAALITDPPYGINIVKNGTAGNFPGTNAPRLKAVPIAGDDKPFDPEHLLTLAPKVVLWGGNHYAGKLPSQSKWLVWDKKDGAFQGSDLGDCELAWTNLGGAARLLHHTWQGMYRKGVGERTAREHPTQKPVDLMAWCCEQAEVKSGEIVLDCYLGSGSTLIACERNDLRCYGIEIEPHYVDVVLRRFTKETGVEPELIERLEAVNV